MHAQDHAYARLMRTFPKCRLLLFIYFCSATGGENFGALRQAIAFVTRARALSAHAAAKVHDEDGEHDAGKLL